MGKKTSLYRRDGDGEHPVEPHSIRVTKDSAGTLHLEMVYREHGARHRSTFRCGAPDGDALVTMLKKDLAVVDRDGNEVD